MRKIAVGLSLLILSAGFLGCFMPGPVAAKAFQSAAIVGAGTAFGAGAVAEGWLRFAPVALPTPKPGGLQ
jgi:hypothetical protein